jgi:peroxiredoxin
MRADIIPGAVFPDYELSDQAGSHRKLSELQGSDPMIVVLSRGGFCPKDRRFNYTAKWRSATAAWSPSARTI